MAICMVLQHQVSPSFLESSYSLSHFANLLHADMLPRGLGGQMSLHV